MMKKRGQISVFVVVGIVVVVLIALIFFFRESISKAIREEPTDPQKYLAQQLVDLEREIGRCVRSEMDEGSKLLIQNGGSFDREFNYITFFNIKYPILCRELEEGGCLSEPILIKNLEKKLDQRLAKEVDDCVDLSSFKDKGYELSSGKIEVNTTIFEEDILVQVNFPIELKKGAYSAEEENFVYKVDNPLGELINVVNEVVQLRASGGQIDPVAYGLLNFNKYRIEVSKPYPDELYDISLTTNDDYHFYFAVEGKGRFDREGIIS